MVVPMPDIPPRPHLAESDGIQIRVLHPEPQSHRVARQPTYITSVLPAYGALDFITDIFFRFVQCESVQRFTPPKKTVSIKEKPAGIKQFN